jgi:hypothetical protein
MNFDGGCLCGGVRYRLHQSPEQICDCHCVDCRRGSAAPFVTWGSVRRDKFELLTGTLCKVRHAGRIRSFAACCGTPLFFEEKDDAHSIDMTISSLEHPENFAPEATIWTEDRLPWVQIDSSRPTYRQGR